MNDENKPTESPLQIKAVSEGHRVRVTMNFTKSFTMEDARAIRDEMNEAVLTAGLRLALRDDHYERGGK